MMSSLCAWDGMWQQRWRSAGSMGLDDHIVKQLSEGYGGGVAPALQHGDLPADRDLGRGRDVVVEDGTTQLPCVSSRTRSSPTATATALAIAPSVSSDRGC